MGYFQTLWMFIWTNIIKNSVIYKLLRGLYDKLSAFWHESIITNLFRKRYFHGDIQKYSFFAKLFNFVQNALVFINKKCGKFIISQKEHSFVIRICNYILHNTIALNLRFLGIFLVCFSAAGIAVSTVFSGKNIVLLAVIMVIGAVISFFDVNFVDFFSGSCLVKFIEASVGTEFKFDYYYKVRCKNTARLITGGILGAVLGVIGGFTSPFLGILMFMGIIFFFLTVYRVEFGVFMVAFLAPIVPTMVLAGLCVLCFFSFVIKALTAKKLTLKFDGMGFLIAAMIVMYLISAFNSYARAKSIQIFMIYAVFMAFYFVLINTVKTRKQLMNILRVFVISGFLVCIYGIMQYVFGWNTNQAWMDEEMFEDIKMRIYSTLENPNVLGEYILLILPLSVAFIFTSKKIWTKLVYTVLSAVAFIALILTFSRGCWIGMFVSAAVFITFVCGKVWGLALIALPIIPAILPESIINRFMSIGDMKDSSTSYRVYIWLGTLAMIKDFWTIGIGMGTEAFTEVYPFYSYSSIVAPHSHNMFLQILVESGVLGIGIFALIMFMFFKNMVTGYQIYKKGNEISTMIVAISAACLGFLVQGMFDNCFYNYRVFMIFWMFTAFGMSCVYAARNEKSSEGVEVID